MRPLLDANLREEVAMSVARSFNPQSIHYTPDDLAVCQKALDAIEEHVVCGERQRATFAESILGLYQQGTTDHNELARLTMEACGLKIPAVVA